MTIHKVTTANWLKTPMEERDEVTLAIMQTAKAYYTGNHPHLKNSMGKAGWDEGDKIWKYKPEAAHSEWYRVKRESLVFEE